MAADWTEVADRCWVRRYEPYDVSCGVVAGADGLLVVDTRCSLDEGRELVADIRTLSPLPVRVVVNTHAHFDHVLGNGAFREAYPDVLLVGHETVPDGVREEAALKGMEPVPPDTLLASVWTGDLGDRYVEAVHPGRGHSAGDVVVRVPDADVVYAGDIVEDAGPPSYGTDCWPLEWPQQLEFLATLLSDAQRRGARARGGREQGLRPRPAGRPRRRRRPAPDAVRRGRPGRRGGCPWHLAVPGRVARPGRHPAGVRAARRLSRRGR